MSKSAGGGGHGGQASNMLRSNHISRQHSCICKRLSSPQPKCQLSAFLSIGTVSTSLHLEQFPKQGQNVALLEEKGNWFKPQTTGFLSPSIVGNSKSLQYTCLQDTCGGIEKTEMTNSSESKHSENRCVIHECEMIGPCFLQIQMT